MDEAGDFAAGEFDVKAFFEIADRPHRAVCLEQVFSVDLHCVVLPWLVDVQGFALNIRSFQEEQTVCQILKT
jgi:hypothetical protein